MPFFAYFALLSAKCASSTSLRNKNKSFMKILNKLGPNTEPYGTPNESI